MRTGRASALTDTGRRRPHNEDTFVCEPPLFAVADGVGGAQAGEIASRIAAAALEELPPDARGAEPLAVLLLEANNRIYKQSLDDSSLAGMGTVVTVLLFDESTGTVSTGHVGDSRAYRMREGALVQLTTDHSLVGELVRAGRLSTEEAESHPHRSVITRAVGTEAIVEVDTATLATEPGDLYLICSDGLTDLVRDEDIALILTASENDPDRAAEALVDAANRAGGLDNITVVLFEILDGDPLPEPEPVPAPEPDENTAEDAAVVTTRADVPVAEFPAVPPVHRHGAGAGGGGRWLALCVILLTLAMASVIIWWSLAR